MLSFADLVCGTLCIVDDSVESGDAAELTRMKDNGNFMRSHSLLSLDSDVLYMNVRSR